MQISNIEVFLLVAEVKSLSKAAKLLHLSQPAVSNKINMLEQLLDIPLFHRSPHGVSLTHQGETFLQYATDILHIYHEMVEHIKEKTTTPEHKITIGAESIIGNYLIPCKIAAFKEKFPTVDIKIVSGNQQSLLEQLKNHEIDIACVDGIVPLEYPFQSKLISTESIYLAVPNHEKWDGIDRLPLADIYQLPLILPDNKTGLHYSIYESLKKEGIDSSRLRIMAEVSSVTAIKSLVESGFGVSFLCGLATKKETQSKSIKLVQIESLSLDLKSHVVFLPDKLEPITRKFIEQLLLE